MTDLRNNLEEVWIQRGSFGYVVVKDKDSNPEWINRPIQVCSVSILYTLQEELQKTREQLEKAEKVIGFYANWANYKEQVITREDCDVVPFYFRNDELIGGKRARQYFQDKDKQGE